MGAEALIITQEAQEQQVTELHETVTNIGSKSHPYAILVAGHATEYLRNVYGGLAGLFEQMLSDPGEQWHIFRVIDGDFPSDEEVYNYEGFVITGSRYDAHSNEPWVLKLCKLVQKLHAEKIKVLGICFGHQVISRALGGQTGRSEHGWEVGLRQVSLADAFYIKSYAQMNFPSAPIILDIHQDQVNELPPNGEVLASTEKTSIWMYAVEDHILCIQGHPEFTEDIAMDIFDVCWKENLMPEDVLNGARLSFAKMGNADNEAFQQLCKAFLKATPLKTQLIDLDLDLRD